VREFKEKVQEREEKEKKKIGTRKCMWRVANENMRKYHKSIFFNKIKILRKAL